jgi:cytochrome P450
VLLASAGRLTLHTRHRLTTALTTQVGPYRVPAGVIVLPCLYTLLNSSANWVEPLQVGKCQCGGPHTSQPPSGPFRHHLLPITAAPRALPHRPPPQFKPERWLAPQKGAVHSEGGDNSGRASAASDGSGSGSSSPAACGAAAAAVRALADLEPGGPAADRRATGPPAPAPGAFIPFSTGPKRCVGQHLAIAQAKAALALLLGSGLSLALAPRMGGAAGVEARALMSLELRCEGGLWFEARPRV